MIKYLLKKIYFLFCNFVFDLFFPKTCVGCGSEGQWICNKCIKDIEIVREPFCPECRTPTSLGEFCDKCRSQFSLDGVMVCAKFEEGVLREAIHEFKYNFIFDIGEFLGVIMAEKIESFFKDTQHSFGDVGHLIIVPVPLHKKRIQFRGFNQAEILAGKISSRLNVDLNKKNLKRVLYTSPQAELSREQRLVNVKKSFVWTGGSLSEKNILLVDDVTTTGSTLEECAKTLKDAGAEIVWGIVLGRG